MLFPEYEFLKSLDLGKEEDYIEYKFNIFDVSHNEYVRITLNEDNNKKICVDIMSGGYLNKYKSFPFNKMGWKDAKQYTQDLYDEYLRLLTTSNKENSEYWNYVIGVQ